MKPSFKQLALLAVILSLSLPTYSRAFDEKHSQKTAKMKETSVQQVERTKASDAQPDSGEHDGAYWFDRGFQFHQADHYVEAIEAFSHSIGLGHRQATAMYNVACGYTRLNDKENALFWLERSLASGFDRIDLLKEDSDLDPLRSDARFKEIVAKASLIKTDDKEKEKEKRKENANRDRLDEAIINFEQLRSSASTDGDRWYKVGSRLLGLRDFERAAAALSQAIEHLGYRGSNAMYNLACTYALKGDTELGLKWLERSVNAGFDDQDKLRDDPDIAGLRSDPRFRKIQELASALSLSEWNQDSGDSQFSKERWAPAVKHYRSFLEGQPNNGRAWFNLGFALHYSSEHAKAIDAFQRAIALGYRNPTSLYNIACANAMMGNRDAAFEYLDKSARAGFDLENYVNNDPDLESLRSDSRFQRFVDMADDKHKEKHKDK